MEARLYARFSQRRKEGLVVRRIWFQLASKLAFRESYPDRDPGLQEFEFSTSWFNGFLSRWNISLRATTNKAQYVPAHYQHLIVNWLQFNRQNSQLRIGDYRYEVGRFDLAHIANMDQTPLPFEYLTGRTYSHKGDKTIWAKSEKAGWDKRQATLVLTAFADGIGRVKPLIIFRASAKMWPASDTVVLHPDLTSLDSASCTSCASCAHAPHLVASSASRDPCRHWVSSGHMPLSNPASHAS